MPVVALVIALLPTAAPAADWVWPLSGTVTPDAMTTSFGPRINYSKWDFHDGIDLGAALGTTVYAMRDGTVVLAGPGGTDSYSSRHVVIRHPGPGTSTVYAVYVHLSAIPADIVPGTTVFQGQQVAFTGDDDATWGHLHFETRLNTPFETGSVHPLGYLPYPDTANWTAPVAGGWNIWEDGLAARLPFGASDRNEGDLWSVEVTMYSGATVLDSRMVDFNNKVTINEGNGDEYAFRGGIAVDGYQSSNMAADGWNGLDYGMTVRGIPAGCDTIVAILLDRAGRVYPSAAIPVPAVTATGYEARFDGGGWPAGGRPLVSSTGSGTTCWLDAASDRCGCGHGLYCLDASTGEADVQRAAVEFPVPAGRFEWTAEGFFNPVSLGLGTGESVYPIEFTAGGWLSAAARIRNTGGVLYAGLAARRPDGTLTGLDSATVVGTGSWKKWRLSVRRLGTRMSTVILSLDGVETVRLSWSTSVPGTEPDAVRFGIGLSSAGATAGIRCDDLQLCERRDPAPMPCVTDCGGLPPPPPVVPGSLEGVTAYPAVVRAGGPASVAFSPLPAGTEITIMTASGRRVRRLPWSDLEGATVRWDLDDERGRPVSRGVYLAALVDGRGNRRIIKVLVAR